MLKPEERKAFNTEFWSKFRLLMRRYNSSNKRGVNWLNYPTDVKHVYLRLHCDNQGCAVRLDFQFKDAVVRDIVWEQMGELKAVMEQEMGNGGTWKRHLSAPEGFIFDRIEWSNNSLNYYQKEHWPEIHTFLKEHLLAFDRFYQEFKEVLVLLVD
ncbi:MAG: DUF4268 domain-containing protein [Bacteroidetes bacterium]|nr:DUF4268 domain-containing protein [Bacteroidota bacterium]